MERRNNKTEKEQQKRENLLQQLVDDFSTQKQHLLMQMKKGQLTKELFLSEAAASEDRGCVRAASFVR